VRDLFQKNTTHERRSLGHEVTKRSSDNAEKFTELFRANRLDILKYLIRRSASPEEAADALAETFLVAWRRIDVVPDGIEGRLWLYGVARNILLKQFAKRQRATVLNERLASELTSAITTPADVQLRDQVLDALSQLSISDREIVQLSAWEELAPNEIASVLGISNNAARVRLHRAKQRLAVILVKPELTISTSDHEDASRKPV
jgi:RNA polymerase sigma-70 factor (ECF subfamily)